MPTTVILREVAVSMVECQGRLVVWLLRWQGKMDSATARGMTKFGFRGYPGNDEVWVLRLPRNDGVPLLPRNDEVPLLPPE